MIIVDLINDEAPLFAESIKVLLSKNKLNKDEVLGVSEGHRWKKEIEGLNLINRLSFFDSLDKKKIDIDLEIDRISRTYNNFNIYACDRYLINKPRDFQKKMLVYMYLFYENLFKNNVTHYFTTGIAFAYNYVSFEVSKKFNVKHIAFYGTRLGNNSAICLDTSNSFNEIEDAFKEFSVDKVTPEMYIPIKEFLNKPAQPAYMKNAVNASNIKLVFIKEFFIRFMKFYLVKRHKYDFFTRNPFELSYTKLKKIIKAKKTRLFHDSIFDRVDFNETYFVFPLHMQPEASTLVMAPHYVDQKAAIINISRHIPPNVKLYVKEHLSALGQNNFSFYKELKKYPNIKLISYKENMIELIKKSMGTINLSSTAGLETLLLKKPSIVFGKVFYNKSGLTFKIDSFEELSMIINKIVFKNLKPDEFFMNYDEKLAFYVHCIYENSYPFEFNVAKLDTKKRIMKKENIINFSECLYKLIHK